MSAEFDELSILEYSGQLQSEVSAAVRAFSLQWGACLFDSILETHVLSETQLRDALARALQLKVCDEIKVAPGWRPFTKFIDYRIARSKLWLVGSSSESDSSENFVVFVANPITVPELKKTLENRDLEMKTFVVERSEVVRAIDLLYPLESQLLSFS